MPPAKRYAIAILHETQGIPVPPASRATVWLTCVAAFAALVDATRSDFERYRSGIEGSRQ